MCLLYLIPGNVIKYNGLDVLNLTSVENIKVEAQNVPSLSISNNMMKENNGSCSVWLRADGGKMAAHPSLDTVSKMRWLSGECSRRRYR